MNKTTYTYFISAFLSQVSGHDLARLLVFSFLLGLIKKQKSYTTFLFCLVQMLKKKAANKNPKYILYVFGGSTHSIFTL